MAHIFDDVHPYLPKYLTAEKQEALRDELRKFPDNMKYYLSNSVDGTLQGDLFDKKHFIITSAKGALSVRPSQVMIISNSCDIAPENRRDLGVSVLVAPIMQLSKYEELLRRTGTPQVSITSKLAGIRQQEVTSLFYLPSGEHLHAESIVLFDAIQAVRSEFLDLPNARIHTLSQAAFYLLLVKLSIHFCRAREGVDREAA